MLQISNEETITFHVHALQTHKAAVITAQWLAQATIDCGGRELSRPDER